MNHQPSIRTSSRRWAAVVSGGLAVLAATLSGCGSSSTATATGTTAGYPVTISNCGTSTTYDRTPTRAVSNDIDTTEDMLALGLQSHMIGEFGATGSLPAGQPFPAPYTAGFKQIPDLSSQYFTLEPLVGARPDFLFAGWNYGLKVDSTLTPTNLDHYGIKTLALTESCAHVQASKKAVTIDNTYQDLTNLGRIFNTPGRAQALIASMRRTVAAAANKVAHAPKVTVFDYDSGTAAPFTGPGLATPTAEIALAGGTNIFASLKQTWTSVSWEQVVAADPQCIIINDYGTPSAAAKEAFLETSPITRGLTAVKNRCFLALTYDEVTPGPRNAEAVVALTRWLHPSNFGLPADGS